MEKSPISRGRRLSVVEHAVLLGVLWGALYLAGVFRLLPFSVPLLALVALYALFWLAVGRRPIKGGVYQDSVAYVPNRYTSTGALTRDSPEMAKVYRKRMDFKAYIRDRNNRNLFITGRSGSGKSTLMRYLINLFPESSKTIFSFKAGDEYLKLGIPILRVADYAGNPFQDREAFVQAFLVTYPITSQGVVAASVQNLLRSILKRSNSWRSLHSNIEGEMAKEKSGSVTSSAYAYILQKLADLELPSSASGLTATGSFVLDFSGLNEAAKSFYAELYLRQKWHEIEASAPEPMKHIMVIDEAHRLLKSEATIFGEVARLIRSKGALWCGTQNYSDLEPEVRNQFTMQLLFSTKSERDLRALKEINALLPFVAVELRDHYFTDVAMCNVRNSIPIYTTEISRLNDCKANYIKAELPDVSVELPQPEEVQDYTQKIMEMLNQEASWPNKLAKRLIEEESMDLGKAKFIVSKALQRLQKDGEVDRQMLPLGNIEVMLYYRKDPAMSGLHKFMEREVTKKLEAQSITYELAMTGEDKPDIMTKNFDIEIETGLKHDISELARKLTNATKKTYIVVPSEVELEHYRRAIDNPAVVTTRFEDSISFK